MKEITYVWHDPTETPTKEGRYLVTNIVGSVCIAFYGKYRELENYNYFDCKKKYSAEEYVDGELEPVSIGWYSEIEHYDDMDDTCFFDMGCDPGDILAWTEFPEPYKKETH